MLLEAARRAKGLRRFVQVSTDEVYGSVPTGASTETDELRPRNPYSASKAGADRLAYSYWATYDVPVIVTRASNNYGPYQFPEKVIPLFVTNAIDDVHIIDSCQGRFIDNPLRKRDDIVGRFFTGIFDSQQRFVQDRRLLPFFWAQILVARAARQTVFFPDSGHCNHLDLEIEIAHHPSNNRQLLKIFFAEHGCIRRENIE